MSEPGSKSTGGSPRRSGPSDRMQAVICLGPENYQIDEVDVPDPGPGEALVRVEAIGICASDLKCYHGASKFWGDADRPAWAETDVIPGHEFVGEIVELDQEARRRWNVDGATGSCRSRSFPAGSAGTAAAVSTGCARCTTSTGSSGRPRVQWPAT